MNNSFTGQNVDVNGVFDVPVDVSSLPIGGPLALILPERQPVGWGSLSSDGVLPYYLTPICGPDNAQQGDFK